MWPWVASKKAPTGHRQTFNPIFQHRGFCITWAAWVVLATRTKHWRDPGLVKIDKWCKCFSHALVNALLITLGIRSLSSLSKFGWFRRTRITNWLSAGRFLMWFEIKCRSCLETLWRTTEPPTDLLTINPIWGALELPEEIEFVFR